MSLSEVHRKSGEFRDRVVKLVFKSTNEKKLAIYNSLAAIVGVKPIGSLTEGSIEVDTRVGAIAYEAWRTEPEQAEQAERVF